MKMVRNKVCGADIHKKFLVATIISIDGTQISERFGMKLDDILKLQVAHATSRTRNSRLKSFFMRIKAKKGTKVAIVALARKVLCKLHHLLVNREMYEESGNIKTKTLKFDRTSSPIQITEQDMIDTLVKAGYIIKKTDKGGGNESGYRTSLS